ncbi:MAG: orotidine-5'-phosphate decarboxylase [Candidatus Sungbacteria bacterium]|uniref:Orotidine 5'-phosphate decarboxylase n=1 Tax=Candidatus Sungiibacteriota bacterium TaxID=2750080 RepID=A0A931SC12_9BACT|nr:orotidine-5'-phosphate decarboxylase [Candidatus Sungbacteria bacterium]
MEPKDRLIVAFDVSSLAEAEALADQLKGIVTHIKIGSQLFTAAGPSAVKKMLKRELEVFLDLKFHDIPNTVEGAAREATKMGVHMFNVHCSPGTTMMEAAVRGARTISLLPDYPLVLGVTVLTSHTYDELRDERLVRTPREVFDRHNLGKEGIDRFEQTEVERLVLARARRAKTAGLDGVVASVKEVVAIRQALGPDFIIVTPGLRPAGAEKQDQARVDTIENAARNGADYFVVGRPITQAADPVAAAKLAIEEIERGLAARLD